MPDENAAVLEFAAILGEAIARVHISGKRVDPICANAPVVAGRGVRDFVGTTKEMSNNEDFTTKPLSRSKR